MANDPLDMVVQAAMELTHGLRGAGLLKSSDHAVVRLSSDVGDQLEIMMLTSGKLPHSDRYGARERIADGAIASCMIAGVEFQWPRRRFAKQDGTSTHYPHREIGGPDGWLFRDRGSND